MRNIYLRSLSVVAFALVGLLFSLTGTFASRAPVPATTHEIVPTISTAASHRKATPSFSIQGKGVRSPLLIPHARITVTTTTQKIGGPPGSGCSLQEAIYAANFSSNLAPDPANPNGPFIRTECVLEVDPTAP